MCAAWSSEGQGRIGQYKQADWRGSIAEFPLHSRTLQSNHLSQILKSWCYFLPTICWVSNIKRLSLECIYGIRQRMSVWLGTIRWGKSWPVGGRWRRWTPGVGWGQERGEVIKEKVCRPGRGGGRGEFALECTKIKERRQKRCPYLTGHTVQHWQCGNMKSLQGAWHLYSQINN